MSNVIEGAGPRAKPEQVIRMEELGSGVTYIGWAPTDTSTGKAKWRLMRMTEFGDSTMIEWADGNKKFDNVWDDRAGLVYN